MTRDKNSHPTETFDLRFPVLYAACVRAGVLPGTAEYLLGEPNSLLSQPMPRECFWVRFEGSREVFRGLSA